MNILVCGGRDLDPHKVCARLMEAIPQLALEHQPVIISGGATGADTGAIMYANKMNLPKKVFPAQWKTYGKSAGPKRNQQMIDEGNPSLVIAFPGGRGTADMIARAHQQYIKVWELIL